MDIAPIVFAGIGGVIGGLIGALISKRISNSTTRTVVLTITIVIFAQAASQVAEIQSIRDALRPTSSLTKMSLKMAAKIDEDEDLKKAFAGKSLEDVEALGGHMVALGLRRLSFPELKEWKRLMFLLTQNNKNICSGLWTGKSTSTDLHDAWNELSEDDLESWVKTRMKAASLELNEEPFDPSPPKAFVDGVKAIVNKLDEIDQKRFNRNGAVGANVSDKEACWATLTLLNGIEKLPEEQQEQFLRALTQYY